MVDTHESHPDAADAEVEDQDQDPLESVISTADDAKDTLSIDCCNLTII